MGLDSTSELWKWKPSLGWELTNIRVGVKLGREVSFRFLEDHGQCSRVVHVTTERLFAWQGSKDAQYNSPVALKLCSDQHGPSTPDISTDDPVQLVFQHAPIEGFDIGLVRGREGRGRHCERWW